MFEFLKKKLKQSIEGIKKAFKEEEEEVKEETKEEITEEVEKEVEVKEEIKKEEVKKPKLLERIFKKKEKKEKPKEKPKLLFEKRLSEEEFEKFFKNLEISFLQANVAYEVIQLLKEKLKEELVDKPVKRGKVEEKILNTIKQTFEEILIQMSPQKIIDKIEENKRIGEPTKFLFLGVNGTGKTTSLAKFCKWLQDKGYSVVLSASDTFRAASIEQLEKHAKNLGVKVIKHKYGADPAAVAYDAIAYARAHNIDCVLIDSAGRQHTSKNLMDELAKLKRVAKPDFTIFVADALTGNDAVEQAKEFGKIGFDAAILAKADVDQKGGAILSVSYVSEKPILFLGVGQDYKDLEPFDKEKLIQRLIK
ncbi:MAG: signal recognition particle-docking protein FtsY [Nanoarchaeota archaeon]|nr:signal recognition particle-docking protein FtsY [Nanoarchaeota archaeon]